jgi:multiple sugar transport system ATP-binding protein
MRAELKELQRKLRRTVIYVTHDQVEAMTMADRIVVMHDGVVEQIGDPLTLYDRPVNTFVAGFIGSPAMNMYPTTVTRTGTGLVARTEFGVDLPLPPASAVSEGQKVIYGLRPEHAVLTGEEDGLPALVSIIEPLGSQTAAMLRFADDAPELQMLSPDRLGVSPDEKVHVRPALEHVHLFDADTGRRLE